MGFTVEDMLIIARDKYDMELIAGKNGWANSISWLLMVEDTTITANFKGKELVVTQGVYFNTEERLLELVEILDKHHCAGLIVNTGYYIKEIPQKVIDYCDEVDLPLMDVPWDVVMSEMIKDLTVRIFLQSETDQQISDAFIKSFESPAAQDKYREKLSASFDVDGRFQVVLISTGDLDSMDSMDRRRIGYRLQIYMENISHNGHFFYYNGYFVLILNQVTKEQTREIIMGFMTRAARRMPDKEIYCGVGSPVMDVSDLHLSYRRAEYA
nr:PucR family transcriptional regulator ligand-binding domain-containing protein [Lachnospiraceae bacterium]